jgi:membrane protein DedA with SNARE-associated domain
VWQDSFALLALTGLVAVVASVFSWILDLPGWVVLIVVFTLPALESSAFVGFVFPGEIAVILGGVIASRGNANLAVVALVAIAGAVIGDSIGYYVGKRWGRRMLNATLGRFVKQEHFDRAEAFLARRGGAAVFIGRWTAALRVMVPGLAGMAGLRYRTFFFYNVLGGAAWATAFVLLGYVAGESYDRVAKIAGRASLLLLGVIVVIGGMVLAGRWVARHPERVRELRERFLALRPVRALRGPLYRPLRFLVMRFHPRAALGLSVTIGLVVIGLTGWAFGAITQDVVARESSSIDDPVNNFFIAHRDPTLTSAAKAVTFLGSWPVLIGLVLIAGLVWWLRRRTWRPLLLGIGAYGGATILSNSIKALIDRPRPPASEWLAHVSGSAFPSGHATESVAVYGMIAALAAAATPYWGRRVGVWVGALILWTMIGATRLYLGVHWLTDVLGGAALGGVWLFSFLTAVHAVENITRQRGTQRSASATPSPERKADTISR